MNKAIKEFQHEKEKTLSKTSLIELIEWSYNQTINPTEKE